MSRRSVILIVDDEVSNIEILSAALEDDYEICFATSAEEAYESTHQERCAPRGYSNHLRYCLGRRGSGSGTRRYRLHN
jgi:CheY-like chemotaxis protein